jgi:hypothetical protein
MKLLAMADSIEDAMCKAGYRDDTEAIRPANEARFEARWECNEPLQTPAPGNRAEPRSCQRMRAYWRHPRRQVGKGIP